MSAIELQTNVVQPRRSTHEPLPILRVTFVSRKAEFAVSTSEYAFFEAASISLLVGPIGLHLRKDEARALAAALIAAADHYDTETARLSPEAAQ